MRGFLKVAGAIVVLLVSWVGTFVVLTLVTNDWINPKLAPQNALLTTAIVFFGFWFVHTGRLARMFRKV